MKLISSLVAKTAVMALVLGMLAGCDAGGSSVADGGIRGTGSSVGPVSGFGSVFVNGVEFFTDEIINQNVISNDGVENEAALQKGMILRINGMWNKDGTGTAKSMEYDDTLRGQISNLVINAEERRLDFEIHGQPVFADMQTVLKGKVFAALTDGDFVRISGWRQANGIYRASYIGYNPANYGDDKVEVEGPVDNGSVTSTEFTMNGLIINFSDAVFAEGLSFMNFKEAGAYFEIEGNLEGDTLKASRVQRDDYRRYRKRGVDTELAGPISSDFIPDSRSFGLNGLTIYVTNDTEFDDITIAELNTDVLVQVEGKFISETGVQASTIEARDGDVEVEGNIDSACGDEPNCFMTGGVRIQVTARTIITDDDHDDDESLTIESFFALIDSLSLNPVSVEVSGIAKKYSSGKPYVEALKIELEADEDDEYEIEGVLEDISEDGYSLTMLGVRMRIDTDTKFKGITLNNLILRHHEARLRTRLEIEYESADSDGITVYKATEIELD